MTLYVAGTGSKANCYILTSGADSLALDAGVAYGKIIRAYPGIGQLHGCLVTHEHMDHARAISNYLLRGIPVIASKGTLQASGWDPGYLFVVAEAKVPLELGPWTVLPFDTQHDAAEPLGFLIRYRPTGETVLYATDTYYIKYQFPGIHYWIIECNFCEEMLSGDTSDALQKRLRESHMSLRRLRELFEANDLTDARKIVLVHLSDSRSDEARMVREIQDLTGCETVAARNGETYALELEPF